MKDVDQIAKMIERELTLNTFAANPVDTFLDSFEEANDEPRSSLLKLWDAATKHKEWKACMAAAVGEVSPPGWEGTVKAMKKHPEITNPWALSWWMDGQGMSSHKQSEMEGGPGSGRRKGSGASSKPEVGQAARAQQQRSLGYDATAAAMSRRLGFKKDEPMPVRHPSARALGYKVDKRGYSAEGGPGSGRRGGGGSAISAYGRASGLRQATPKQVAQRKAMRKRLGLPQ